MTLEQKVQMKLGEAVFAILNLECQVERLTKENEELKQAIQKSEPAAPAPGGVTEKPR